MPGIEAAYSYPKETFTMKGRSMQFDLVRMAVLAASLALPVAAAAHGTADHKKKPSAPISTEEHAFGIEGDPRKATRTIALTMDDAMRYSHPHIRIAQGETITLAVTNKGKLMHELVLGTEDELKKHAQTMLKNPGMEHDEPYMAHVKPGTTERITWTFTRPGTFHFGCLVPGHFEAGMKGVIVVASSQ